MKKNRILKFKINTMKKSIIELEAERLEWSLKTFPEATAISSLRKLESEIEVDIVENHKEPLEYADALMCLFDSAGRHGISSYSHVKVAI